jgi:3-hydroxyisobutyrate dehydrogenase-like beta-hydroxyacid dehydrogenase
MWITRPSNLRWRDTWRKNWARKVRSAWMRRSQGGTSGRATGRWRSWWGQVAKAANQIMVAAQMVAMGELLMFAQKAEVDPQKVIKAIQGGAAQCWTLDVKPDRLFAGNRKPGFKAHMQAKDLNIVLETARAYGIPLPSTAVNAQLYNAMLQNGMGELDNSAVIGMIEALAGEALKID